MKKENTKNRTTLTYVYHIINKQIFVIFLKGKRNNKNSEIIQGYEYIRYHPVERLSFNVSGKFCKHNYMGRIEFLNCYGRQ